MPLLCPRLLALLGSLTLVACGRTPYDIADGALEMTPQVDRPPSVDSHPVDAGLGEPIVPPDLGPTPDGLPNRPDLTVLSFTAAASGATVTYTVKMCNQGTVSSGSFTIDVTYNSSVAPLPKQKGDQAKMQAGIPKGTCAVATLQRTNTPSGQYSSWVQLDSGGSVVELDETNNIAGPVVIKVQAPLVPDLVIKTFNANVVGSDIFYDLTVCNVGTGPSFLFRIDIYYNRLLPPGALQIGDVWELSLGLAAGACQSISRTYKGAAVGLYNSWAFVDTLGTVKESDEANNAAGPKVLLVSSTTACVTMCTFVISCGVFKISEYPQCLTWCNNMGSAPKACATKAQQAQSCTQLKACTLPPLPPPPPPPWSCITLCNYLIDPCKVVPQTGMAACSVACLSLPSTKIQCGLDAMAKKQCAQMVLCIL
jgi:hypothetical protein